MQQNPTLVEAARQGDIAAAKHLLVGCCANLRRTPHPQSATVAGAEDAVRKFLLPVYRWIGVLRTIASPPAWMFTIARCKYQRLMWRTRDHTLLPAGNARAFAYCTTPGLRIDLAAAI